MQTWRWQLTLRDYLVLVAIVAIGLGVGARLHATPETLPEILRPSRVPQGVIEGALTGVGLLLIFAAFRLRGTKWRWLRRIGLTAAGLTALWFAAVDIAVHVDWCQRCGEHTYIVACRVYRVPAWEINRGTHKDMIVEIAEDLGAPCSHDSTRSLRYRFWGLVYPYPCVGGICCLSDDVDYADYQPFVRQMAAENPGLPAEFHQKAFIEHDRAYLKQFFAEVRARREAQLATTAGGE